ncbi:MAG: hypothetical protein AAGC93_07450 [Cyanobacteria bacterium P01_F01_bin.53]
MSQPILSSQQGVRSQLPSAENSSLRYPQLACQIHHHPDRIVLSQNTREFAFPLVNQTGEGLTRLFMMMDGNHSLRDLQATFQLGNRLEALIQTLEDHGLLNDTRFNDTRLNSIPLNSTRLNNNSSSVAMPPCSYPYTQQDLSTFAQTLLLQASPNNRFWALLEAPGNEPSATTSQSTAFQSTDPQSTDHPAKNYGAEIDCAEIDLTVAVEVAYGFAIELYHLFSYQPTFQSASVVMHATPQLRELIQNVYALEYGHTRHIAKALLAIEISEADLADTLPLPSTMALCNAFSFWANFDSVFYRLTLAAWKNKLYDMIGRYLRACEVLPIPADFSQNMQQLCLSELNRTQADILNYRFSDPLDLDTYQRLKGQVYLLLELLNGFSPAIVNYYAGKSSLLRRVSVI